MCSVLSEIPICHIFSLQSDPAILGGMIVSIGDKYVDMSTKTKIQKLTKIIRDT